MFKARIVRTVQTENPGDVLVVICQTNASGGVRVDEVITATTNVVAWWLAMLGCGYRTLPIGNVAVMLDLSDVDRYYDQHDLNFAWMSERASQACRLAPYAGEQN